jgi:hypothetical protein
MVNKFLLNLLIQHGGKIAKSVFKAYKDTIKDMPKGANSNTNNSNTNTNQNFADKFSFNNFMTTPMTEEEALKILNIKLTDEVTSKLIMEQFEKYMESNNPEKGGSFYLQNKIYYAKEFLMLDFPAEENQSKYNPEDNTDSKI